MINFRADIVGQFPAAKIVKQFNYGTAVGLTKTAKEAQAAVQGAAKGAFKNRKAWYAQSSPIGIKVKPATVANPVAEIYAQNYFLPLQESGGIKIPFGNHIAVPARDGPINKARTIPAAMRPKALISSGRGFIIDLKSGHKAIAVRGLKKRGKFKGLTIVYFLVPKVKITAKHVFFDPIKKVVDRRMGIIIDREISKALNSIR